MKNQQSYAPKSASSNNGAINRQNTAIKRAFQEALPLESCTLSKAAYESKLSKLQQTAFKISFGSGKEPLNQFEIEALVAVTLSSYHDAAVGKFKLNAKGTPATIDQYKVAASLLSRSPIFEKLVAFCTEQAEHLKYFGPLATYKKLTNSLIDSLYDGAITAEGMTQILTSISSLKFEADSPQEVYQAIDKMQSGFVRALENFITDCEEDESLIKDEIEFDAIKDLANAIIDAHYGEEEEEEEEDDEEFEDCDYDDEDDDEEFDEDDYEDLDDEDE